MKINKSAKNTRALARSLFAGPKAIEDEIAWPRRRLARWVVARLRVDSGTWRYPIGVKHDDGAEIPVSLHKLPPGPPLVIAQSSFDKRRKALRYVKGLLK